MRKIRELLSAKIVVYSTIKDELKLYRIESGLNEQEIRALANDLTNHIHQKNMIWVGEVSPLVPDNYRDCDLLAVKYFPGLTNNLANTVKAIIEHKFDHKLTENENVKTADLYLRRKELTYPPNESLYNSLVQQCTLYDNLESCIFDSSLKETSNTKLHDGISHIILLDDDLSLEKFSKDNLLSLGVEQMKVIRDYFLKLNRDPTQIELEMLAQSWSEHCKHNIFSAEIDEIKDGLYKHYIKKATEDIHKDKRDFCISVFSDNAGAIAFDDEYAVVAKVETHNSPSALEPFGGAITGILGVNRDVIGFGLGALPVANHYAFCFYDDTTKYYRDKFLSKPILSNENIELGVTKGVNVGGNHSGIPTTNGLVHYGAGFVSKPLVFVGTVGFIPIKYCFKQVYDRDLIVIIGGRTGMDGIHGATFSSENLNNISSNVVQIGDAITQKKLSDAIIKEARDLGLYNSITDNGAGGFSSSIGEMGRYGFVVDLEKVVLKCSYMDPWEIWVSESQERMTLAVPKNKYDALKKIMQKHDVEIIAIGEFNNSGKAIIRFNGETLLNLDTDFIHEGCPRMKLSSEEIPNLSKSSIAHVEDQIEQNTDLLTALSHKNIKTRSKFARQYDHEVQARTVLKPLQGKGKVFADATILKPLINSNKGIVQSQSLGVFYEDYKLNEGDNFYPCNHPYFFAERAIETAIRNIVVAGGNIEKISLLDNFCWSNFNNDLPYNKKRLWQLKMATKACYDVASFFKTPFISGKDSMFNNATLYDENGKLCSHSNFPTLLITSVGIIDDVNTSVSLDVKIPGDLIYVVGDINKISDNHEETMKLYKAYQMALNEYIIASGIAINFGGIAVAIAKKLIGGLMGANVNFAENYHLRYTRFPGIIVTIDPKNKEKFEKIFNFIPYFKLGHLTKADGARDILEIKNVGKYFVEGDNSLKEAYSN